MSVLSPTATLPAAGLDELPRTWGLLRVPFSRDEKNSDLYASGAQAQILRALDTTAA